MIATSSDAPAPLDSVESFFDMVFDYPLVTISPPSSSLGSTKARRLRELGERERVWVITKPSNHGRFFDMEHFSTEPATSPWAACAATMHLLQIAGQLEHEQSAKCKKHTITGMQSTRAHCPLPA